MRIIHFAKYVQTVDTFRLKLFINTLTVPINNIHVKAVRFALQLVSITIISKAFLFFIFVVLKEHEEDTDFKNYFRPAERLLSYDILCM